MRPRGDGRQAVALRAPRGEHLSVTPSMIALVVGPERTLTVGVDHADWGIGTPSL